MKNARHRLPRGTALGRRVPVAGSRKTWKGFRGISKRLLCGPSPGRNKSVRVVESAPSKTAHKTGVPRAGERPGPQVPHSEAFAPSAVCGIQKANIEDESKENLVSSTEFPWVVSIQDQEYTHLAFGCILSEFWILSSASALQNRLVPQREGWEGPLQAWGFVGSTHLRVYSPESRS